MFDTKQIWFYRQVFMKTTLWISLLAMGLLFSNFSVCSAQDPAEQHVMNGAVFGVEGKFQESGKEFEKALQIDPTFEIADIGLKITKDVIAPDGSDVRLLARGHRGSMAHFELVAGQTSKAVAHKTVEEIWYFLDGHGEMWRKLGDQEEITTLDPNVSITIPVGVHFQFRSLGTKPLSAVAVTMPPWPGADEAYAVTGKWPVTKRTSK